MVGSAKKHKMARRILLILASMMVCGVIVVLSVVGMAWQENRNFKETFYTVVSDKVNDDLRIIQISDLHTAQYENLVHRIEMLKPDMIVLTGDILNHNSKDDSAMVELCGQFAKIAPTYYVYGNHERELQYSTNLGKEDIRALIAQQGGEGDEIDFSTVPDSLRDNMEAVGVEVLMNEQATLQIGNTTVDVFGVLTASFDSFYEYAENAFYQYAYQDEEHFKLMLIHEPYFTDWITSEDWGDLILCGHTHGGIMQLPYVGGLYESEYGFLPEFLEEGKIYGKYSVRGIPMIVSSGLANNSLLRINNKPELVIVDVNRY